jgi:hypothetical protein
LWRLQTEEWFKISEEGEQILRIEKLQEEPQNELSNPKCTPAELSLGGWKYNF